METAKGLRGGRKPIEKKPVASSSHDDDRFLHGGNALIVPKPLLELAKKEEIEFRWLKADLLEKHSGYHPQGWHVFYMKQDMDLGLGTFHAGKTPDGAIRRGSMVLGFKPTKYAVKQRNDLAERAKRLRGFAARKADQLRSMAAESRVDANVVEGYEENS